MLLSTCAFAHIAYSQGPLTTTLSVNFHPVATGTPIAIPSAEECPSCPVTVPVQFAAEDANGNSHYVNTLVDHSPTEALSELLCPSASEWPGVGDYLESNDLACSGGGDEVEEEGPIPDPSILGVCWKISAGYGAGGSATYSYEACETYILSSTSSHIASKEYFEDGDGTCEVVSPVYACYRWESNTSAEVTGFWAVVDMEILEYEEEPLPGTNPVDKDNFVLCSYSRDLARQVSMANNGITCDVPPMGTEQKQQTTIDASDGLPRETTQIIATANTLTITFTTQVNLGDDVRTTETPTPVGTDVQPIGGGGDIPEAGEGGSCLEEGNENTLGCLDLTGLQSDISILTEIDNLTTMLDNQITTLEGADTEDDLYELTDTGGTCPTPLTISSPFGSSIEIEVQIVCDILNNVIKPLVTFLASFIAVATMLGSFRGRAPTSPLGE